MAKLLDENALIAVKNYVGDQINAALTNIYKIKGSQTCSGIDTLLNAAIQGDLEDTVANLNEMIGDVYNVTNSGEVNLGFVVVGATGEIIQESGHNAKLKVLAGDNLVMISEQGTYGGQAASFWKWDKLAGLVDLSGYMPLSGTASLSGSIVPLSDRSVDLGSSNKIYGNAFIDTVYTKYITGIGGSSGSLLIGGSSGTYTSTIDIYAGDTFSASAGYIYLDAGTNATLEASRNITLSANSIWTTFGDTFNVFGNGIAHIEAPYGLNFYGNSSTGITFGQVVVSGSARDYFYGNILYVPRNISGTIVDEHCFYEFTNPNLYGSSSHYTVAFKEDVLTLSQCSQMLSSGHYTA